LFYSYEVCGSTANYIVDLCTAVTERATDPPSVDDEDECNGHDECKWEGSCVVDTGSTLDALAETRQLGACPPLYGNSGCPCLKDNGQIPVNNKIITDAEGFSGHEYPLDYGEQCTAHAEPGSSSCSGPFPAGWCADAWCYVDPCNCDDESIGLSDYFSTTTSGKDLYYSYATCGSTDSYSAGACASLDLTACAGDPDCVEADGACTAAGSGLAAARDASSCPVPTTAPAEDEDTAAGTDEEEESSGLSTGVIAGAAVGGVVILGGVAYLVSQSGKGKYKVEAVQVQPQAEAKDGTAPETTSPPPKLPNEVDV
jgi:hypothetical protein